MLNQVILIGNLGGPPVTHYNSDGLAVTSFTLAFNSFPKRKDPNWIRVSCFQKLAEITAQYLTTGSRIAIVGVLEQRKWQGENGETKSTFQLVATNIEFIKTGGKEEKSEDDTPF